MGLPCFEPEGAFYVFPDIRSTGLSSEEFCKRLIYSERVAIVPGNAFGECGEGFVRVAYSNLQIAMDYIRIFQLPDILFHDFGKYLYVWCDKRVFQERGSLCVGTYFD